MEQLNSKEIHTQSQRNAFLPITAATNFVRRARESIEARYVIVKEGNAGADGVTFFCIAKPDITASDVTGRDPNLLRDKICVIKCPSAEVKVTPFIYEIQLMFHLRSAEGCVRIIDAGGAPETPWFAMTWLRGGDIFDSMSGKPCTPAFAFHVLASLLTTALELRGDLTDDVVPVLHADIHDRQILLDTSRCTYPPFPDVKLIDFGRAIVGSLDKRSSQYADYRRYRYYDLRAIGVFFHELAHERHVGPVNFVGSFDSGSCNCTQLEKPDGTIEKIDFGSWDTDFHHIIAQLSKPLVKKLSGNAVAELAALARRRCNDALQASGRKGQPMILTDWDKGGSLISDMRILDVVQQAEKAEREKTQARLQEQARAHASFVTEQETEAAGAETPKAEEQAEKEEHKSGSPQESEQSGSTARPTINTRITRTMAMIRAQTEDMPAAWRSEFTSELAERLGDVQLRHSSSGDKSVQAKAEGGGAAFESAVGLESDSNVGAGTTAHSPAEDTSKVARQSQGD